MAAKPGMLSPPWRSFAGGSDAVCAPVLRIFAPPNPRTRAATEVIDLSWTCIKRPIIFSGWNGKRDASSRRAPTGTPSIHPSTRSQASLEPWANTIVADGSPLGRALEDARRFDSGDDRPRVRSPLVCDNALGAGAGFQGMGVRDFLGSEIQSWAKSSFIHYRKKRLRRPGELSASQTTLLVSIGLRGVCRFCRLGRRRVKPVYAEERRDRGLRRMTQEPATGME